MDNHDMLLDAYREVLRAAPLSKRRALLDKFSTLAAALSIRFEEVEDLFQDQREGGRTAFFYLIYGGTGGRYDPMTLQQAADVMDLKPEYLRTRLSALEAKNKGVKLSWFTPRRQYPSQTGGTQSLSVRRYRDETEGVKSAAGNPPRVESVSSDTATKDPQQVNGKTRGAML